MSRVRGDLGGVASLRIGPWQVEVLDIAAVPPQFLIVDQGALRAHAQHLSKEGSTDADIERQIPGVRLFRETSSTVR
jgi:hypothetical protein